MRSGPRQGGSSLSSSPGPSAAWVSVPYPGALVVLLLASTLGVMGGAIVTPVLEIIRGDLGVGGTAAGLIITTHGLTIAVVSPLAGWMTDRWGVRTPLGAGLVLYGLAGGAGTFTTTYPALITSRVFFGVGAAMVFTGTTAAMLAIYRGAVRDRVMGWRTTATSLGGVVWPLIGGALGGWSWHATFSLYLIGVPVGIAALVTVPEVREETAWSGGNVVALLRRRPALFGIYGLLFVMMIMMYGLAVFLPRRLAEVGVHEPLVISLFMAAMAGAASVIGLFYARIRRRLSYAAILRSSMLMWAVAFLILGIAEAPGVLIVSTVLFGLGNGVTFPALTVLMGDLVPSALLGRATAISGSVVFLGQFCSPLLLGPVMSAASVAVGYLMVAGLAAVLCLAMVVLPIRSPRLMRR